MSTGLSRDIALRIALAARVLPDTDVSRLLKVLESALGLPLTINGLSGLSVKILRHAHERELADLGPAVMKEAVAILKGEKQLVPAELPSVQAYNEGDMSGSIRVACASNTGENVDGHFGSCQRFLVYQIDTDSIRLIDIRNTENLMPEGDKNVLRAELIEDCDVLFVASIGGPAAAKVVKAGIYPMKQPAGGKTRELLADLQQVLAGTPPPWLAKVMGQDSEQRVRFKRTDEVAS